MKNSNFLSIKSKDLIKGFIVAILSVVAMGIMTSLNSGVLPTMAELKPLALTGAAAGISYLLKNFLTNSEDKFMTGEKK